MPTANSLDVDERLSAPVFEKSEIFTDCISSIESSFDIESPKQKIETPLRTENKQENSNGSSYYKNHGEKRVVIAADAPDDEAVVETSFLRRDSDRSTSILSDSYLTMSGTIKRGKKKGENVDVILNMSREELEVLEAAIADDKPKDVSCNSKSGPHIVLFSLLFIPLSFISSAVYSFWICTITWYNIFSFFSEEKPLIYRVLVTPCLIVLYPFLVVILSLGLGVVACILQISWHWSTWLAQITDLEKGFYGWLCNVLSLPDCSPYEVVVLSGIQKIDA